MSRKQSYVEHLHSGQGTSGMVVIKDQKQSAAAMARDIERRIRAYIKLRGCGDEACDTCKVGVAIGLKSLDRAFEAGSGARLGTE